MEQWTTFLEEGPGAQSPDNLIMRDLKRSQFIGSINMDSLFIARTSDIATGVEVRLPFVRIGAEELKMASSTNWIGNFSDLGRQTNLDAPLSVSFRIKFPLIHQF